jgi:hypothetical protein
VARQGLPKNRAERLAAELEIGLDRGICMACLSIVSWSMRTGTPAEVRSELFAVTPTLWYEGLAEVAVEAIQKAVEAGVPDAEAALSEIEARQARSGVARAIVRHLAVLQIRHVEAEAQITELARARLAEAHPDWN